MKRTLKKAGSSRGREKGAARRGDGKNDAATGAGRGSGQRGSAGKGGAAKAKQAKKGAARGSDAHGNARTARHARTRKVATRAGRGERGHSGRQKAGTAAAVGRKAAPAGRKAAPAAKRTGATPEAQKQRTAAILARLENLYPDARCSLQHGNPLQLLIATILSAQCTDARVNMVTPALFRRYPTAKDFAEADVAELEGLIRSTGFYRNKARNIIACAQQLLVRHGGQVPSTLEELVQLPGIGRKTANVVLGNAFGIPGLVVDTHVTRLSNLLSLTAQTDPNKIEFDLMEVVPRAKWTDLAHLFIEHGRRVCVARRPRCADCVLSDLCPSSEV